MVPAARQHSRPVFFKSEARAFQSLLQTKGMKGQQGRQLVFHATARYPKHGNAQGAMYVVKHRPVRAARVEGKVGQGNVYASHNKGSMGPSACLMAIILLTSYV